MDYTEIRFRPRGGGVWWGDSFREFAARAVNDGPGSKSFERKNSPARITFVGGKSWVGIRAYGDTENHIAALDTAKAVGRDLDARFGGSHRAEINSGEIVLDLARLAHYRIRRLVLPRNRTRKHFAELMKVSREHLPVPELIAVQIPEIIREGINEYFPGGGVKFVRLDGAPLMGTPVMVHGEPAFTVANLAFSTNFITGPLQVGSLRARGYGDVRRVLGGCHD